MKSKCYKKDTSPKVTAKWNCANVETFQRSSSFSLPFVSLWIIWEEITSKLEKWTDNAFVGENGESILTLKINMLSSTTVCKFLSKMMCHCGFTQVLCSVPALHGWMRTGRNSLWGGNHKSHKPMLPPVMLLHFFFD